MADSRVYQRASYPLMLYNFRVAVDGASMSFSKVSGLQREYQTLTYRHGLSFREGEDIVRYRHDKFIPLTLERGSMPRGSLLYDWLEKKDSRVMDVSLCDETGAPLGTWHVARALAVKLTAPAYSAQANEVAIETLELMAAGISWKSAARELGG
jgi:phage tail-like protein